MSETDQTREDQREETDGDQTRDEEREEAGGGEDEERSEAEKAEQAKERYEGAQEKMKELEEMDEPPSKLEDWPDDQAKYVTYGGPEGDHSYDEGPEAKLGPPDLERKRDGSVFIEGEEADNPDDYKEDPVAGGPTDPDATVLPGEKKKWEKMERMYGEEGAKPDALQKAEEQRGGEGGGSDDDEGGDSDSDSDSDSEGSESEERSEG